MSRLIQFRPGVFAWDGELRWAADGEAWKLYADGTWRLSDGCDCGICANPPPELRTFPTAAAMDEEKPPTG